MSLQAKQSYAVPEDTARIARTIFPEGSPVMSMLDELHLIVRDQDFADLFPARGQPAEAPGRLALATLLQFMESLRACYEITCSFVERPAKRCSAEQAPRTPSNTVRLFITDSRKEQVVRERALTASPLARPNGRFVSVSVSTRDLDQGLVTLQGGRLARCAAVGPVEEGPRLVAM